MIELLPRTVYSPGEDPVTTYDYLPTEKDMEKMSRAANLGQFSCDAATTPLGAVIIDLETGEEWADHNTEFTDEDLLGHPEIKAYQQARASVGRDLSRCAMYSVGEPCYGCTYFTVDKANLGILYIGAKRDDVDFFRSKKPDLDFCLRNSRRSFTVISGLLGWQAQELLQPRNNVHSLVP